MASRKSKAAKRNRTRRAERLGLRPARGSDAQVPPRPDAILIQLKPKPCAGESVEDLAVFTRARREELAVDLQPQATAVDEALELVSEGDFDAALGCVKNISRTSPYADWRLFIRGLVAFYRSDLGAARQNWSRLDRSRRPARMAATLLVAETDTPLDAEMAQPPAALVDAVQELRLRRGAVAAARRIAEVRHRDRETSFSASQATMLIELRDQYRRIDSDFVALFSQACLRLSHFQPHVRIFEHLKKTIPGPAHDPHWNLQYIVYLTQFEQSEDEIRQVADEYVNNDLPKMTHLPQGLSDALASCVWVLLAMLERVAESEKGGPFAFMREPPDFRRVEKTLREAIKKYRANRTAHDQLIEVFCQQRDDHSLSKARHATLTEQIIKAKEALVKVFPDDADTTLWLIDHYFDEDELARADALVQKLSGLRVDDPRAKALPFNLKLREAMRLCRRKTGLADARRALDDAESIWPTWLSRNWLPFLRAAIECRAGKDAEFERLSVAARQACGAADWVCDCMAFAAMQQMHVPSGDLKPMRTQIDGHARNVNNLPFDELCALGAFFWDLTRTGMRHKAYRLQASKFGKNLCKRLKNVVHPNFDGHLLDAIDWAAEHRFWQNGYTSPIASWYAVVAAKQPRIAAAGLKWHLSQRYSGFKLAELQSLVDVLEQAARSENDPFYRHRFTKIGQEGRVDVTELEARRRESASFASSFDSYWDDDDDDQCNCPGCRAERGEIPANTRTGRAPSASGAGASGCAETDRPLFDSLDDDPYDADDEFEEDEFGNSIPPVIARVLARLGPDGLEELTERLEQTTAESARPPSAASTIEVMTPLFLEVGLSELDAMEFAEEMQKQSEAMAFGQNSDLGSPAARLDAEERRAIRNRRRKDAKKRKNKRR